MGAVFISYCSQDAPAAERICESLRAAGIEVWFDRNELRGGDVWDSKIKKQIHDCAIFVAVVSAQTNARTEGYFRREWKLATRRLLDIADDSAFLIPVVIDGTHEAHARVPEEFTTVQWTRLPGGEAPPAFAEYVRQLINRDLTSNDVGTSVVKEKSSPRTCSRLPDGPLRMRHSRRFAGAATALTLLLGGGIFWYYQSASDLPVTRPPAAVMESGYAAAPHEKSIAVLPFADMSPEGDHEYMSDGIAEELLNLLAQAPDIRVIARTSSFAFKGQNIGVSEIAKKLNVAHVLEGSVRTSDNRLRITAQLVRTADSTQLWSEKYDRPLNDIFAVQDEIANAIVQALQIRLAGGTLSRREGGTSNLEAYQLYLRVGDPFTEASRESLEAAEKHLEQALKLDPNYGRAWSRLGWVVWVQMINGYSKGEGTTERARQLAQHALSLSPDIAEAHALMQTIYATVDWDWTAAEIAGKRALALDPMDPFVLANSVGMLQLSGNYDEALRILNSAILRNPLDVGLLEHLALTYYFAGRYADAENTFRQILDRQPNRDWIRVELATSLLAQGNPQAALDVAQEESDTGARLAYLPIFLQAVGRQAEADAALKAQIEFWGDECAPCIARTYAYRGEYDLALQCLERAYQVKDPTLLGFIDEPLYRNLVDDPRFKAFVRNRLKLSNYREAG
jgi:TolB-like protein/Tfp pilus assembly protein PilF